MVKAAVDLHALCEDDRITAIGEAARAGNVVGVAVEKGEKADRYVAKMAERFPTVGLIKRLPFTSGVELLQFGPATLQ